MSLKTSQQASRLKKMNKIDYLILVFFIAVVLVALYIRFTYQPPVNLDVTLSSSQQHTLSVPKGRGAGYCLQYREQQHKWDGI